MTLFKYASSVMVVILMLPGCSDGDKHHVQTEDHVPVSLTKPTVSTPIDPALQSLELKIAAEELVENSETNVSVISTYIDGEEYSSYNFV